MFVVRRAIAVPRPWLALLGIAALVASGCAGQIPEPVEADAARLAPRWPGVTVDGLAEGRRLYIARCSGCHALYRPGAFPAEAWPPMVSEMAGRARLSPAEADSVIRYLVAASSRPPVPTTSRSTRTACAATSRLSRD